VNATTSELELRGHGFRHHLLAEEGPAIADFLNLIAEGYGMLVADEKAAALELLEPWGPDPTRLEPGPADTRDGPSILAVLQARPAQSYRQTLPTGVGGLDACRFTRPTLVALATGSDRLGNQPPRGRRFACTPSPREVR
jgi:hypothetical protein